MDALIDSIIPSQNFELVRDRLAEILAVELNNQVALNSALPTDDRNPGTPLTPLKVWIERIVRPDHEEVPTINVSLERGDYGNKDITQVDGTYIYNIDIYARAKVGNLPNEEIKNLGDYRSNRILQRLAGMCRAILESPKYDNLGYTEAFTNQVAVQSIQIGSIGGEDTQYMTAARMQVMVNVPEYVALDTACPLANHTTTVYLEETDKGYVWVWSIEAPASPTVAGPSFTLAPEYAHLPVVVVYDGSQAYNSSQFTQVGAVVTMTNGVLFAAGQELTVRLKLDDYTAEVVAAANGTTFQVPALYAGKQIAAVFDGTQMYLRGDGFTQTGTTIEITNGTTIAAGQKLTILYGPTALLLTVAADGTSLTLPTGYEKDFISIVGDGTQAYNRTSFVQDGATCTLTNGASLSAGQKIIVILQ